MKKKEDEIVGMDVGNIVERCRGSGCGKCTCKFGIRGECSLRKLNRVYSNSIRRNNLRIGSFFSYECAGGVLLST